mmetsp:Transcript_85795/g.149757  ORF Transcript_85795/g.149757 Transcript_85795/m.149757 type:complete len:264 (+) Transcript_85795:260-1051(+)
MEKDDFKEEEEGQARKRRKVLGEGLPNFELQLQQLEQSLRQGPGERGHQVLQVLEAHVSDQDCIGLKPILEKLLGRCALQHLVLPQPSGTSSTTHVGKPAHGERPTDAKGLLQGLEKWIQTCGKNDLLPLAHFMATFLLHLLQEATGQASELDEVVSTTDWGTVQKTLWSALMWGLGRQAAALMCRNGPEGLEVPLVALSEVPRVSLGLASWRVACQLRSLMRRPSSLLATSKRIPHPCWTHCATFLWRGPTSSGAAHTKTAM